MGINEPHNFFDMRFMTEVIPGFVNSFTIKPTKIIATNDIRDLSPLERKCRFDDEKPDNMTLFKKYSNAACKFECMVSMRYYAVFKCFLICSY